jgi:hypothetical protein
MVRKLWIFGVLVLLSGSAAVGCHRSAVQQKPPPDPLLVSVKVAGKKPVEGQPQSGNHATASQTYPLPPSLPDATSVTPAVRTVPLQAYKD